MIQEYTNKSVTVRVLPLMMSAGTRKTTLRVPNLQRNLKQDESSEWASLTELIPSQWVW